MDGKFSWQKNKTLSFHLRKSQTVDTNANDKSPKFTPVADPAAG